MRIKQCKSVPEAAKLQEISQTSCVQNPSCPRSLPWWIQMENGEDGVPTNQMIGFWKVGLDHNASSCFHSLESQGGMWSEWSGNEEVQILLLPWLLRSKPGRLSPAEYKLFCAPCVISLELRTRSVFRLQGIDSVLL